MGPALNLEITLAGAADVKAAAPCFSARPIRTSDSRRARE
jgi:hypothetical protein